MELPIDINGGPNPCYLFYVRLADCAKRETFKKLMCRDQLEDYRECKTGMRYVKSFDDI